MTHRIFAKFDAVGLPLGFWDESAYASPAEGVDRNSIIPHDAVEITAEQWREFLDNQGARRWQNGQVVVYTPIPAPVDLYAYAAAARWKKETGGIVVYGMPIATDERTQGVLTAAYASAINDPGFTIPAWKIAPGTYVTLDNATILNIAAAVRAHVQACFSKNREVDAAIAAGTITTTAQIDTAFGG